MDMHLAFWCYAYLLMFLVLVIGYRGIKMAKNGDLVGHMKTMIATNNLLLFFVVSYLAKAVILGREDKSAWETLDLVILYTHELMILLMLIFGVQARLLASKFKDNLEKPTQEDMPLRQRHAVAGKRAFTGAIAAFVTATGVMWVLFRHLA